MRTPNLTTFIQTNIERRERQVQTSFPAKVISWATNTNTVKLEPQFTETWVTRDGERTQEQAPEGRTIENVPVLFPRSGSWAITFPIETGSYGLVTCTKYSLDTWRNQGAAGDPGDLRRFTMSGAVFHPVNLYPDSATLTNVDTAYMEIGKPGLATQLAGLASKIANELGLIRAALNNHTHTYSSPSPSTGPPSLSYRLGGPAQASDVGSSTVKISI